MLISVNQSIQVPGELQAPHVARAVDSGTVSERKHLGIDAVAGDGIFPSPRVVLEAIQVINSHGDRAVHYIVSSSMEQNVRLWGL